MQITTEDRSTLEKALTCVVPAQRVQQVYQEHLNKLIQKAKIPGFRPGKVPVQVIKNKFGQSLQQEVTQALLQQAYQEGTQQAELRVAATLDVKPGVFKENEAFECTMVFEVFPHIELKALDQLQLTKKVASVSDGDVDKILSQMQKQHATWIPVTRAAKEGDQATIDFIGKIDDKPFENGAAQDFKLELGAGQMIPGFESGIVGLATGETKSIESSFPKDYMASTLAGKTATFEITLKQLEEAQLPAMDAEFAKKMGSDSVDKLRENSKEILSKQAEEQTLTLLKQVMFEQLLKLHPFELPSALVAEEQKQLQAADEKRYGNQTAMINSEDYKKEAEKRVATGLILHEVVSKHKIVADPSRVRQKIEQLASRFPNPQEVIAYYYENKKLFTEVELSVLEDAVVNTVTKHTKVTEELVSLSDLTSDE